MTDNYDEVLLLYKEWCSENDLIESELNFKLFISARRILTLGALNKMILD